ncbi:MAG: hypothetical protein WC058_01805 [Phycisphaeraceae bacterium]
MRTLIALTFLLVFVAPASAEFQSQEEVSKWMAFYYQHPEPAKVPEAIEFLSHAGILDKDGANPPTFGFLAGVFRENPKLISGWVERLGKMKESHLSVVVLGLWYANLPESQKLACELVDKHPQLNDRHGWVHKATPMPVEKIPLERGPWVLDVLWGNFMATGQKTPVVRIMAALPWMDINGDTKRLLVGGAARWSLLSNAAQHPRVLAFCEAEAATQPEEIAAKLREIIADVKKRLENEQFPHAK